MIRKGNIRHTRWTNCQWEPVHISCRKPTSADRGPGATAELLGSGLAQDLVEVGLRSRRTIRTAGSLCGRPKLVKGKGVASLTSRSDRWSKGVPRVSSHAPSRPPFAPRLSGILAQFSSVSFFPVSCSLPTAHCPCSLSVAPCLCRMSHESTVALLASVGHGSALAVACGGASLSLMKIFFLSSDTSRLNLRC